MGWWGQQEEVALHGNMTIPQALCMWVTVCPYYRAHVWGYWLLVWRQEMQKWTRCVCVYICDNVSVWQSLQHSLWISLLSEGGPNILTVQGLLPGVGECKCVCCCCNVLAGHWLPIHKLGIPRWKRYVCASVCVCVHLEPLGYRWESKCWTVLFWSTGLPV